MKLSADMARCSEGFDAEDRGIILTWADEVAALEDELAQYEAVIDALPEWIASPPEATEDFILWCPACGNENTEQTEHASDCLKWRRMQEQT